MARCEITHITTRGMRSLEHVTPSWNSKHDWKINFDACFIFFSSSLFLLLLLCAHLSCRLCLHLLLPKLPGNAFPPLKRQIKRHKTITATLLVLQIAFIFVYLSQLFMLLLWFLVGWGLFEHVGRIHFNRGSSWGWAPEYKLGCHTQMIMMLC